MKIEFFYKETGEVMDGSSDDHFVMGDEVYRNNQWVTESQEAAVDFDDFITECVHLGWRVMS